MGDIISFALIVLIVLAFQQLWRARQNSKDIEREVKRLRDFIDALTENEPS